MREGFELSSATVWEGLPTLEARPSGLVYFRESGPHAESLLASLVERTVYSQPGLENAEEIVRAGISPLVDPAFPGAIRIGGLPKGKAVLCQFGGTWVLYVLSSAAARDIRPGYAPFGKEENAATQVFCDVIRALRPMNVYVLAADRLVRALRFAPTVWDALRENWCTLHIQGQAISVHSPGASTQFEAQAAAASAHHKSMMQRLQGGYASLFRRGRWPFAPHTVPFGFTLDGDQRLAIEPAEQEYVRALLPFLRDSLVWSRVAKELAAAGLNTRRRWAAGVRVRHGEEIPTARGDSERSRWEQVRRVAQLLPDLAQGRYVMAMTQSPAFEAWHAGARVSVNRANQLERNYSGLGVAWG